MLVPHELYIRINHKDYEINYEEGPVACSEILYCKSRSRYRCEWDKKDKQLIDKREDPCNSFLKTEFFKKYKYAFTEELNLRLEEQLLLLI